MDQTKTREEIVAQINLRNCQTIEEVIKALEELIANHGKLIKGPLEDKIFQIYLAIGKREDFKIDVTSPEEMMKALDRLAEKTKAEKIDELSRQAEEKIDEALKNQATEETKLESRLTRDELKALVREYEEHLIKENGNKEKALARLVERNRKRVGRETIERIIAKQTDIKAKVAEQAPEMKTETVKAIAENQIVLEEKLIEAGVAEKKAEEIGNRLTKEAISPEGVREEVWEKTIEELPETLMPEVEEIVAEARKEVQAEVLVATETDKIVDQFVEEIKQESERTGNKIGPEEEQRLRQAVAEGIEVAIENDLILERDGYVSREEQSTSKGSVVEVNLKERIEGILQRGKIGEQPSETRTEVAIRTLDARIENIKTTIPEAVREVKMAREREEIETAFMAENPELNKEQRVKVREFARGIARLPNSGIEQYRETVISQQNAEDQVKPALERLGKTNTELGWQNLSATMRVLRTPSDVFNKLVDTKEKLEAMGVKVPLANKLVRPIDRLLDLASKNPAFKQYLNFVQKKIAFFEKFNHFGETVALKLGMKLVASKLGQKILGQAGVEFAKRGLAIMAEQGIATGAKAIVGQLAAKFGLDVMAKGVAGAVAGTAAGKVAIGLATKIIGFIPGIGWLIMAAITVVQLVFGLVKKIIGFFKNKIKELFGALGIDLDSIGLGIKKYLQGHFGKFLGGIMNFVVNVGIIMVTIPTVVGSMAVAAAIGPILIVIFIGLFIYQLFQTNLVSTMVPSVGMGGQSSPGIPILINDCASSPACAVIYYLQSRGIFNVNIFNVRQAANYIDSWPNPPMGFDKTHFNARMISNTTTYLYFQCLGFNFAVDKNLTLVEIVQLMTHIGHPGCQEVNIQTDQLSAGDHAMYIGLLGPHIFMVSVLRDDGTGVISQANTDFMGAINNMPVPNMRQYLINKRAEKGNLMVLRCR